MSYLAGSDYPEKTAERDQWILAQRPARNVVDPKRPYAYLVEKERSASGMIVPVATIFLTNRECPWRCLMCDLWRNTLTESVPLGAIPAQISYALAELPAASEIKLYNSGSFFDPQAIPPADYGAIASLLDNFERVIVECHPALVGSRTFQFRELLEGRLEVAMGLETVHPEGLTRMNKRMTLEQFRAAAETLRKNDIDLRVFVLVQPPFVPVDEALDWAEKSIDFAFDCGATAVTVIPTRAGNGAMEWLQEAGEFKAPTLSTVEAAAEYGVCLKRGRVFVDLWDAGNIATCETCRKNRIDRLAGMNRSQNIPKRSLCAVCDGVA